MFVFVYVIFSFFHQCHIIFQVHVFTSLLRLTPRYFYYLIINHDKSHNHDGVITDLE